MGELLLNKNILIMGVRNKWSIAWGIAKEALNQGAKVIFTGQSQREKEDIQKMVDSLDNCDVFKCDVNFDEEIDKLFEDIKEKYGELHGVVHAIAHAKTEDLKDDFINTSRDGFAHAMDVSAYSLIAVSNRAKNIMNNGGSILTLTYIGSEKVFKGYNVMGVAKAALETSVKYMAVDLGKAQIRINGISAGAIKTMSAKGIKNFTGMIDIVEEKSPLKRRVTQEDIGNSAVYYLSDFSKGTTGEITHVDCGYNIIGV